MAYDEGLAQRLREMLQGVEGVSEKRMFGGLAFLIRGHMCVGVVKDELMVRVGHEVQPQALAREHVRKMDFTGKPFKGFVFVSPEGFVSDEQLSSWVGLALDFVALLPDKMSAG